MILKSSLRPLNPEEPAFRGMHRWIDHLTWCTYHSSACLLGSGDFAGGFFHKLRTISQARVYTSVQVNGKPSRKPANNEGIEGIHVTHQCNHCVRNWLRTLHFRSRHDPAPVPTFMSPHGFAVYMDLAFIISKFWWTASCLSLWYASTFSTTQQVFYRNRFSTPYTLIIGNTHDTSLRTL